MYLAGSVSTFAIDCVRVAMLPRSAQRRSVEELPYFGRIPAQLDAYGMLVVAPDDTVASEGMVFFRLDNGQLPVESWMYWLD